MTILYELNKNFVKQRKKATLKMMTLQVFDRHWKNNSLKEDLEMKENNEKIINGRVDFSMRELKSWKELKSNIP